METERKFHDALAWAVLGAASLTFFGLLGLNAPYGRQYSGHGWSPEMSNRAGWVVMDLPPPIVFAGIHFMGRLVGETVPLMLLARVRHKSA